MTNREDEHATSTDVADAVAHGAERSDVLKDGEGKPKRKVDIAVTITDAGPCKKHVAVEVPRSEVENQFNETLKEVRRDASMPGFRPGRAPSMLVQRRYRKELSSQVKSALLMACLGQLDEDYNLNPITQPNLDLDAVELPDDGPMSFQFELEVQPEFPAPRFEGLRVRRPTKKIGEADIDAQLTTFLERYAQIVPKEQGNAEIGDFVTADLTFHKDGVIFNQAKELQFRLQPQLRFQDGNIPDLAGALVGAKAGDVRDAEARVGTSSSDAALRGQTIRVTFHVHDLKRMRLPELDAEFLEKIGFEDEAELREALRGVLVRRVAFMQRQALRKQIIDQLVEQVPFDLPPDLVSRQERSTLKRQIDEMRQAGMSDTDIRARQAEARANAHEQTLRGLKEYFLLAKIAEHEEIKVDDEDIEGEIQSIAERTDESPRRVRARVQNEGMAEGLAQQILERKTLDLILQSVTIEDVVMDEEKAVETLDELASPVAETLPETSAESEGAPTDEPS